MLVEPAYFLPTALTNSFVVLLMSYGINQSIVIIIIIKITSKSSEGSVLEKNNCCLFDKSEGTAAALKSYSSNSGKILQYFESKISCT